MLPSNVCTGTVAPKTASHGANSKMADQIGAAHLPIGMLGIAHPQINVAGAAAIQSLAAFARQPE